MILLIGIGVKVIPEEILKLCAEQGITIRLSRDRRNLETVNLTEFEELKSLLEQNKQAVITHLLKQYDTELDYWQNKLSGIPITSTLTTGKRRTSLPAGQQARKGVISQKLSLQLSQKLNEFCQFHQYSRLTSLLCVTSILLSHHTGQKDVVLGTPVNQFSNALALRTRLDKEINFLDLLSLTHETLQDAYANQNFPFESLANALNIEQKVHFTPIFQVMLASVLASDESEKGEGWYHKMLCNPTCHQPLFSDLDVLLLVNDTATGLEVCAQYNGNYYHADHIKQFVQQLPLLLETLLCFPDTPVFKLDFLSKANTQMFPQYRHVPRVEYTETPGIHELFEQQAAETPDAIALVFGGTHLSYRKLNQLADKLAEELRARGVTQNKIVGLYLTRSIEMMVALLAILKAGGAYLPIDTQYPKRRIEHLIADSGTELVLTQMSLRETLRGICRSLLCIDDEQSRTFALPDTKLVQLSNDTPTVRTQATDSPELAYVIYTSGSTGKPKGVLQTHSTVVNLVKSCAAKDKICESKRTLQFTSIAFDVSIQELTTSWYTGSTLVMLSQTEKNDLTALPGLLKKWSIERIYLPPAVLQFISERINQVALSLPQLRQVFVAGEVLTPSVSIKNFLDNYPKIDLWNHYGPTETHVVTTAYINDYLQGDYTPIGKPIDNTQLLILDEDLSPVSPGVIGELYVAGDGVAQGYLNKPELTAERFIDAPFHAEHLSRLYKTGDRVRYLPNGNLEFIGRNDDQVKLRGYRVELGEIEALLATHSNVKACAVTVQKYSAQDQRLLAYVAYKSGTLPDKPKVEAALKRFLQDSLPDYMVPNAFVFLDTLPLTINGKVDKVNLPVPALSELVGTYTEPRGETEQLLASLWRELLNVQIVGREQDFFHIGGHSLYAIRLVSWLKEKFAVEITVREIFAHSSLKEQAALIESACEASKASHLDDVSRNNTEIVSVPRNQPITQSFAQQRLWFLNQLSGPGALYNLPLGFRLKGPLNVPAMLKSLKALGLRHEILRTRFASNAQQHLQVIRPELSAVTLETVTDEVELQSICIAEANFAFDLANDDLCRFRLLQLRSEETFVLLITMHHSISDGWSQGIVNKELSSLYCTFVHKTLSPLAPLNIQYADFANWQRQWFQGELLAKQMCFWKEQLAELPQLLTLPTDKPRPPELSYRGKSRSISLPNELLQNLKLLSQKLDVTLYMTMLSAWAILLGRYAGQADIAIGTPVANRTTKATEELIGFFVNTLVMRCRPEAHLNFAELLRRTQNMALECFEHQDLPFDLLVEELNPPRELSYTPLFQVMFVMQNTPEEPLLLDGVQVKNLAEYDPDWHFDHNREGSAHFDLTLSLQPDAESMTAHLLYNADLFEEKTIVALLQQYQRILEFCAKYPEQQLSQIDFLSEQDKQKLLIELNASDCEFSKELCLHELFQQQVDKIPDKVALVCHNQQLTYRELNERANQLAHYLLNEGVKPDYLVGLCVDRSVEMIIGLLAINKAGGAFVPIDPHYPYERIEHMLQDSGVTLILSQSQLTGSLPFSRQKLVFLDQFPQTISSVSHADKNILSNLPRHNPDKQTLSLHSGHLAYVIYTSGSTGKPKGVLVNHCGVINAVMSQCKRFGYHEHCRVLQLASLSFDVSVAEIFNTFYSGASLVLLSQQEHNSPAVIAKTVLSQQVSLAHISPALLHELSPSQLSSLQTVIVGGEKPAASLIKSWSHNKSLYAAYGPTECTILSAATLLTEGNNTIGSNIDNMQSYVLDEEQKLLPFGVIGELYIGGVGLARGYLNQPQLTREKYIDNPFSQQSGDKLYRTGDLVRWLNNGQLEFIGRHDGQVKIRGFRVELGEIEARLLQHPRIQSCAVVDKVVSSGSVQLVAYVVKSNTNSEPDRNGLTREWKEHLQRNLPDFMLPVAFVLLDRLPLSPNGKIDKKALPAPGLQDYLQKQYVAPGTRTEAILVEVWSELLGFDSANISITANFFELGGHSLLTTQVIAKLQERQIVTDVRSIFSCATLEDLASHIDANITDSDKIFFTAPENLIPGECQQITADMLPLVSIDQDEIERLVQQVPGGINNIQDIYPLAPLQEGILFHHLMHKDNDPYILHSLNLLDSERELSRFIAALQWVIDRHDVLRTAIVSDGLNQPLQVVLKHTKLEVTEITLDPASDSLSQLRARMKCPKYMPLERPPLLKMELARDPHSDQCFILILFHHLMGDHVSLDIIKNELGARLNGKTHKLSDPVPYREFVAHTLYQAKNSDAKDFFTRHLGDVAGSTFPYKLSNVHSDGSEALEYSEQFPPSLARSVRCAAQEFRISPAVIFHAAFAMLVSACSERDDVVFGTVVSGRLQGTLGAENMLGSFINTLPMRINLTGLNIRALLSTVDNLLQDLLTYEQVPLTLAQSCSNLEDKSALFSGLFNYRHEAAVDRASGERFGVGDFAIKSIESRELSNYPFTVSVNDFGEGFSVDTLIDKTVNGRAVVAYLKAATTVILESLENEEETPVTQSYFIPYQESPVLPVALSQDIPAEEFSDITLAELLTARMLGSPDEIVVSVNESQLSYFALNAKANQVANYLIRQGVEIGSRIGLAVDYSSDMMIAIVAILKAGCSYVPLDLRHGLGHIGFALEDSNAPLIFCSSHLAQEFQGFGKTLLYIDSDSDSKCRREIFSSHSENLDCHVKGQNRYCGTACVIYPFVGAVKPGGISIANTGRARKTNESSVMLQTQVNLRTIGLSAAVTNELSLRVHLPLSVQGKDIVELLDDISTHAKASVLNQSGKPIPAGIVGEIHRNWSGVSGYIAAKGASTLSSGDCPSHLLCSGHHFIAIAASCGMPTSFYQTGKWGYFDEQGLLRHSEQKKRLSHFELDGLAVAIADMDEVRAVHVAPNPATDDGQILLYIVPHKEQSSARQYLANINRNLRQKKWLGPLPQKLLLLKEIPLTESGLLDVGRLPSPCKAGSLRTDYSAPTNEVEAIICRLWQEVFGVEHVGRNDNFFLLGGNSLLVTRFISRLRQELDIELPLQRVFERSTVQELSEDVMELLTEKNFSLNQADIKDLDEADEMFI